MAERVTENRVFYPFEIGEFRCLAISDGAHAYPLEAFFANVADGELAAVLPPDSLERRAIVSQLTCLHIDDGQHSILVDAGAGPKVSPTAGRLLQNLSAAGISPGDIDTVIITHGHADHIGGLLDSGGRPVFPKARYTLWRTELDFWLSDLAYRHAPVAWVQLARRQFFVLRSRMILLEEETEIHPGIKALAAFGHTPGHTAVSIASGDQFLLHISDAALSPLHLLHPDWNAKYDVAPEHTLATKKRLFDWAAAENTLIFGHHLPPFPALGYVSNEGDGWQWRPLGDSSA